ncbi:MAG: hypothetical protein HY592_00715 [Candidatus Omnitrophica bacterium]|nr:hypothetical protein [Candidatus Omnitrophota bacterium]
MPIYTSKDKARGGVPLGGIGAGKFEILPSGVFNAFTTANNWSEPIRGNGDYPGVLGYHLGIFAKDKNSSQAYLLQTAPILDIPLIREIDYSGTFPKATLSYRDNRLPIDVELEVFSSFVPGDVKVSSLPAAFFRARVKNRSNNPVEAAVLFMGRNLSGRWCVGRKNKITEDRNALHLEFSNNDPTSYDPKQGAFRCSFLKKGWDLSFIESWNAVTKNFTFDSKHISLKAWEEFAQTGKLSGPPGCGPAEGENRELCGAVAAGATLAPAQVKELRFTAAWFSPHHRPFGHRYNVWFKKAGDVSGFILPKEKDFRRKTEAFQKSVQALPFPDWFNDALLNSLSPFFASSWFVRDGRFAFYEAPEICPLMGTLDVGFYGSIPLAWFFPELERAQILQFAHAQRKDGYIPHDLGNNRIDLASDGTTFYRWKDLSSKFALMAYRDFLWSNDHSLLKTLFPHVERAMAWLASTDKDGNGLPDNEGADQTFDLWDFRGTNAYTAGLYLAALLACERMALKLGRRERARFYRETFGRGRVSFERELWNGRSFGEPILLSQLNGQWYADLLGLGSIADETKIQTALHTILSKQSGLSRVGLVNSVTSRGEIDHSNRHSENVWMGMNYAFVSLAAMRGVPLKDLLQPLKGIWDNSVQMQKSPWNQPDMIDAQSGNHLFGDFYYRNMAIWSIPIGLKKIKRVISAFLLLALIPVQAYAATAMDAKAFLDEIVQKKAIMAPPPDKKASMIHMNGDYRLAMGVGGPGNDVILNDAHGDFQERNFRYIYGERLNNTFDRMIYDQYRLNVGFTPSEEIGFYTQIVADPWSLVGTTGEFEQSSSGEILRYNLKYFGAYDAVLNETWRTNNGDSFSFPLIKVHDGVTKPVVVRGFNDFSPATGGVPFSIPERDIDFEFRPIRKMWLDWRQEDWKLRVFALADQSQALTTDDPLELSNHKDYWQQSPWLYQYKPLRFFTDGSIKRGYYSDNLSFLARDSEGNRLVLLRGVNFESNFGKTYLGATVAAPYTPWDEDYFKTDNIPGAVRFKYFATDRATVGGVYTFRSGLIDDSLADLNQVLGVDLKYLVDNTTTFKLEGAFSHRERDLLTNETIQTDSTGYAAKAVIERNFDHAHGHTELEAGYTQMDRKFEPNLSRYSNTRDDRFWGKHISFDDYSSTLEHFRLGDGIDTNRMVLHFRWREKRFQQKVINLFDIRNVHRMRNTAYLETVLREELTVKMNNRLTAKGLFRWQGLPGASPGIEPFLSNFYFPSDTIDLANTSLENAAVKADKDPSRFTYSGGLRYVLNNQWTAEGILEVTNDLSDFPRGLLNDTFRDANDRVDGLLIDRVTTFLYDQGPLGGAPPYEYFTITKERLIYEPKNTLKFIFHAAQNGYKFAAGIDDNINHQGVSVAYDASKKLSFFADYTHSRQIDLPHLIASSLRESVFRHHHNVYFSADYRINAATVFRAEYGVFGMGHNTPLATPYSTTGFSLPTIDTEHLVRLYLQGEF